MSFVGPSHTSVAWQLHESGVAVWSIGAQGQHAQHLSLDTATIQARYFSKRIAENLEAALLPTLPYGHSMEYKGFRGSISLTPDLLMAFVRQMVDELETQSFTRLIIVNAQSGDVSLGSVVREINRRDRKLKVLIVDLSEFMNSIGNKNAEGSLGEAEASMMLALDIPGGDNFQKEPWLGDLHPSDLNTFGLGRVYQGGSKGGPSLATKAKGQDLIKAMIERIMDYIKIRLILLEKDSRYGGAGPVALRPMHEGDLSFGLHLSRLAHWNQLLADWRMYLDSSEDGAFIAIHNGNKVGTVTSINYEGIFSWIGMVLVDPEIRRCGVGSRLLNKAIEISSAKGSVGLDATPEGQKLYLTLGFKDYSRLSRMCLVSVPENIQEDVLDCQSVDENILGWIIDYDAKIFGARRPEILTQLVNNNKAYSFVCLKNGEVQGYCLGRSGHDFEQIGPIVAEHQQIAQALLLKTLSLPRDKPVIIDIVDENKDFLQFIQQLGFALQRPFVRMFLGIPPHNMDLSRQYAISGPELG